MSELFPCFRLANNNFARNARIDEGWLFTTHDDRLLTFFDGDAAQKLLGAASSCVLARILNFKNARGPALSIKLTREL